MNSESYLGLLSCGYIAVFVRPAIVLTDVDHSLATEDTSWEIKDGLMQIHATIGELGPADGRGSYCIYSLFWFIADSARL